jgi:hypothetical protein
MGQQGAEIPGRAGNQNDRVWRHGSVRPVVSGTR